MVGLRWRRSWGKGAGCAIGGGGDQHTWMSVCGVRLVPGAATSTSVGSFASMLAAALAPALLGSLPISLRLLRSLAGDFAASSPGGTTLVCGAGP